MSFTISLLFPAGRYAAASWDDAEIPEWPPHPARLCLGLLDTLHRVGDPFAMREALGWLCTQPPPDIVIPGPGFAETHSQTGYFVPQNPSSAENIKHTRKARAFPVVFLDPDVPTLFFHWPDAEPSSAIRRDLGDLLAALPRFGHSSSLVVAAVSAVAPPVGNNWTRLHPAADDDPVTPDHQIRIPWDGLVASAEKAYDDVGRAKEMAELVNKATRQNKPDRPLRPKPSPRGRHDPRHVWQGYSDGFEDKLPSGPWDRRILVLSQTEGDCLDLPSTWQLTETIHKSLLDRWPESSGPVPAWISGHASSIGGKPSGPSACGHLAVFPLPSVGHRYSDGHALGAAFALPDPAALGLDPAEFRIQWRTAVGALLGEGGELQLTPADHSWRISLAPENSPRSRQALQPARWTRPATEWKTVTPIILDRHPKPHFKKDPQGWRESCAEIIRQACQNIGLPEPERVEPSRYPTLSGVPPAAAFPAPRPRPGRPPRFHIHATVAFASPIQGPLLLGAGRYRGYGLCLPQDPHSNS